MKYAGFWRRFFAYLIDAILFSVVFFVIGGFFGLADVEVSGTIGSTTGEYSRAADASEGAQLVYQLFGIIVSWLYFALLESSPKQATLGKMALGIKVTDLDGNRISFGRATGRFFAKFISGVILLIGYIMAAFTARKQALHDIIAGTLVVKPA
ncbi:MAG TPA: RDD family protein [Alphaproteobacteria bacterium]|jgi:uncharacterized RDD family membrane protein YckC